jgi:hypothetical protein
LPWGLRPINSNSTGLAPLGAPEFACKGAVPYQFLRRKQDYDFTALAASTNKTKS